MTRRKNNTDDLALTDEEIDALASTRTPELVKTFVSRQQRQVGVRTSAYRKVAAAARAEREALSEIALLRVARTGLGEIEEHEPRTTALSDGRADLIATVEQQRQQIAALTAQGALAHG